MLGDKIEGFSQKIEPKIPNSNVETFLSKNVRRLIQEVHQLRIIIERENKAYGAQKIIFKQENRKYHWTERSFQNEMGQPNEWKKDTHRHITKFQNIS